MVLEWFLLRFVKKKSPQTEFTWNSFAWVRLLPRNTVAVDMIISDDEDDNNDDNDDDNNSSR